MYLVWVVMHLLMGTICAGGRLSPSSSLTPTNFTRSNCLDFFMIFLATDNPEKFLYSGTLTNNPKTSVVSFSSHFSGQSWQIAVARLPYSLTHSLNWTTSTFALFAHKNKNNRRKKHDFGVSFSLGDLFPKTTQTETNFTQEYKGSRPFKKVQFFWTLFKRPLTPPLLFEHLSYFAGHLPNVQKNCTFLKGRLP